MIRLAYRSHLKMLLRLLVTHFLRQMAQEKVMDAVTQAAREHSGQVEGQDLEPEELPMCDIGIVFATGVESGGVVDQLEAARHTSSPSLTEYSGVFHGTPVVVWESGPVECVGEPTATKKYTPNQNKSKHEPTIAKK